jgi:2-dehydropantoate 2-reductase
MKKDPLDIAVIGGGAIGSLVAGYLAKSGIDVLLVARPDQVEAINKKGLRIFGPEGEETIKVHARTRLDRQYGLVIFATKSPDLEFAYQDNFQYLEKTRVLTTQNGVQGDNLLSTHFEPEDMYSSIVMFGATYTTPGEVTLNFPGDWILGKPFTPNDHMLWEIVEILRLAFSVVVTDKIIGMKWLKLFVNFNNCLPGLTGKSMQETYADLDMCRLSIRLLKEGYGVVRDAGIELVSLPNFPLERIIGLITMPEETAAGIIQKTLTSLSKEPLYGSILQSIKRGKPSEIDFINGEVVNLAPGIERKTPLNHKVVTLVHQVEETGKFFTFEEIKKEFCL